LVVGVEVEGVFKGYPLLDIALAGGVVNDTLGGKPIVVVYDPIARTGLAYLRQLNEDTLEFYNVDGDGFEIKDRKTDSTWDVHGRSNSADYGVVRLEFVPSFITEWYGWSAYHSETEIFTFIP